MAGRGVIAITNGRFLRDPSAEKGAVLFDTRAWLTPPLWQEGDACVAPTKVPSSVGARHASPLLHIHAACRATLASPLRNFFPQIRPSYSGWRPASLTILPHLPSWTLMKFPNSSDGLENASKPTLPSFDLMSASSMILRSSVLSRATISGGVWAGATMPAHESMSKPVTPASSRVGNSGKSGLRCSRVTASARNAPERTGGSPVVRSVNIIETRPASTSWSAGGELLYGTCSMSRPAQCARVSPATMPEVLALAKESLPG